MTKPIGATNDHERDRGWRLRAELVTPGAGDGFASQSWNLTVLDALGRELAEDALTWFDDEAPRLEVVLETAEVLLGRQGFAVESGSLEVAADGSRVTALITRSSQPAI